MSYARDPEELAFLAAICAAPEDDLPRFVYADWLDEHGSTDRAEFIRVQIELENLPEPEMKEIIGGVLTHADYPSGRCIQCTMLPHPCRYHVLRGRSEELLASLLPDVAGYKPSLERTGDEGTLFFRRGFAEEVVDTAEGWVNRADSIIAEQPITKVHITTWPHMYIRNHDEGDTTQSYYRLEGRERWNLWDTRSNVVEAGPNYLVRTLLHSEWPTIKTWNITVSPPEGDRSGITLMINFGNDLITFDEAIARLRAIPERESLTQRILRGIRSLFE